MRAVIWLLALCIGTARPTVVRVAFDALSSEEYIADHLRDGLRNDGIVAITGISGLAEAKVAAFRTAAYASVGVLDGLGASQDVALPDGSVRKSFHARGRGAGLESFGMSEDMAEIASFRSVVDDATDAIFAALDDAFGLSSAPPEGSGLLLRRALSEIGAARNAPPEVWTSFKELGAGKSSEQLEHFHVYSTDNVEKGNLERGLSLGLHADAGMFVVFSPGMYWSMSEDGEAQLCQALPTGDFEFEDRNGDLQNLRGLGMDSLLIMVGDGAEKWLNPSLPQDSRLKTALHQVRVGENCALRTWYGRMYLPKQDVWLPSEGSTFGSLKKKAAKSVRNLQRGGGDTKAPLMGSVAEIGCNLGDHRGLAVAQSQGCSDDEFYCWAVCMKPEEYDWTCGVEDLVCLNNDTNEPQDGSEMHGHAECTRDTKSSASNDLFCIGSGTAMIMNGFKSFLFCDDTPPCVVFLYSGFVMDTKWKLFVGCLISCALGALIEYLTSLRRRIRQKGLGFFKGDEKAVNWVLGALYGLQVTLAYYAMLLAMTYCSEIFASVIFGLVVGHCGLNIESPIAENCDPCCVSGPTEEDSERYALLPGSPEQSQRGSSCRFYNVEGMTCTGCERTIRNALSEVEGVDPTSVKVELSYRRAQIRFSAESSATESEIEEDCIAAVAEAGYQLSRTV